MHKETSNDGRIEPKEMTHNQTNQKKLKSLISEINEYLKDDVYTNLYFTLSLQAGVIQDIKLVPFSKKNTIKL